MLDSVKSIGWYTIVGATVGAALGSRAGLNRVDSDCTVPKSIFFWRMSSESRETQLEFMPYLEAFKYCEVRLILSNAIAGGIVGGAIGMIYGTSKEIFKNCRIHIQSPIQIRSPIQIEWIRA